MATNSDLIDTILSQTLACQDPTSPESKSRQNSRYQPLGPYIPGESGSYPTTDTAMEAVAELADRFRDNDANLRLAIGRDPMRLLASRVIGEILPELIHERDKTQHWPMIRSRLSARVKNIGEDIVHYIPVWLFLDQYCLPFNIGPVRFIERKDWLYVISRRRGQDSPWMPGVKTIWAGKNLRSGPWHKGIKAGARALYKTPTNPSLWKQAFIQARRFAEPKATSDARKVARLVHPNQWIACVEVNGFERDESRRRGLLAARVALDTIRLVLAGSSRSLLSTAADSVVPLSVERLSQVAGKDLAHGWHFNRPALGGPPGMAQEIVSQAAPLFNAAGECIATAVNIQATHPCPKLADRWFNAAHWFGRACLADADFTAVVMLVIALDVLCGGLEEKGILELVARLTNTPISASVLPDGTSLKKLVERSYKLRSEVAHGSVLALHETLDVERAQLESLAGAAIAAYAIQLNNYAQSGGADDRDAFRGSLPQAQP